MERFDSFKQFNSVVNKNLSWVHSNTIVNYLIVLILGIYFIQARPKLPSYIETVFKSGWFRFFGIAFVLYLVNKDLQLSIIVAGAFLLLIHMANKQEIENMSFAARGNMASLRVQQVQKQQAQKVAQQNQTNEQN